MCVCVCVCVHASTFVSWIPQPCDCQCSSLFYPHVCDQLIASSHKFVRNSFMVNCVCVCVCVCVCACVFFKMRFLTTIDFFSCYHLLLVWQSVPTTFADRYKPLAHDCINIKAQCFLWSHPVLIISRKDRNCLSSLLSKGFELNSSTYHV